MLGATGAERGAGAAGAGPGLVSYAALVRAAADLHGQRIPPSAERGREWEERRQTPRETRVKPSLYCICQLLGGSPA